MIPLGSTGVHGTTVKEPAEHSECKAPSLTQVVSWEYFNQKMSGSGQMWKQGTKQGCSAVESSVFPQGKSPLHAVLPLTGAKVF